ncbi:hypothetical protein E1289_10465 [Actinomadura sp. 6K520]|nr:hypothetical protein E1289_10465 [Actinomadura sp. 6K520]
MPNSWSPTPTCPRWTPAHGPAAKATSKPTPSPAGNGRGQLTGADRRWVAAHHGNRALLHRVDPRAGLTEADFSLIHWWLAD